jgi:predicted N-acetyltransferase YhbS
MHIRPEAPSDHAAVHDVNVAAFGRDAEARLESPCYASRRGRFCHW